MPLEWIGCNCCKTKEEAAAKAQEDAAKLKTLKTNFYAHADFWFNAHTCSDGGKHNWVGCRDYTCTKCKTQNSDR
jgi:hypothetical protein